jgi:HTH-type transcriptional regulator, competence development regulator
LGLTDRNNLALGEHLAAIRMDRKLTLRQVEAATNKEVSNGYLSQIEKGHIAQPSPNILNALADLYEIDYTELMKRAGYVRSESSEKADARHSRVATFAELNLTGAEEEQLMKYLKFLRTSDGN